MLFKKTLGYYEPTPRWHVVVYENLALKEVTCYPIGLHMVMLLAYKFKWLLTGLFFPSVMKEEMYKVYDSGYSEGYQDGQRD